MRTSCVINNYNYEAYVAEAVGSALRQTRPFDEILVIDDGSTDGSLELLHNEFGCAPGVRIVAKANGGQLSCFNHALEHASGELLCYLDADDRYRPEYLERVTAIYELRPDVDFVFVEADQFGSGAVWPPPLGPSRDWGLSVGSALLGRRWIGAATSCLSLRAALARRILPYPFEAAWRIRADDVLVLAASVLAARKYALAERLVEYRVHGANGFSGRRQDPTARLRHGLAIDQLLKWYADRESYDVDRLTRLLHRELATIERPTWRDLRDYAKLALRSRQPLLERLKEVLLILACFSRARTGHADDAADQPRGLDYSATIRTSPRPDVGSSPPPTDRAGRRAA
jgi:glycosyltransferase involved in cell wall biosynthesis